jgi:hypothetical protein
MDKNRVLVGLPERLDKAKLALRDAERLLTDLESLYGQRLTLNDRVVLDQMAKLMGWPIIRGDADDPSS